jgi:hypothetical protein
MIISNRYGMRGKILDTGKEFDFCKAGNARTNSFNALKGFTTGQRHEFIEIPEKLDLRPSYRIKFLDTDEEYRVVNWEEELYNEQQVNFTCYGNVDIVTIVELE